MKKLFFVGAVALFASVNAQEVKFGAKAGYAMSTLTASGGGTTETSDPKSTFYVGGLVEYALNDKFALSGEVLYSPLGGESKSEFNEMGVNVKLTEKVNLGTLLIPVGAKYYVADGFALGAGLNFGIIMSAKADVTATATMGGVTETQSESVDLKDEVNSLNLAPYLGAEYNLSNGLFFDARYNLGVSNLAKNSGNGTMKNSFFQVGLGYKFGN